MIERYTRSQMKAIWDLKHKYEIWLEVELQATAAFERAGQAPRGTAAKLRKKAKIDVARIAEIEKVTKHDVIAFLESLMDTVGPEHRFLHMGLTSSDIVDTSLAIQMTEALDLILEGVEGFSAVLKRQAFRYKAQIMVGRSHGIHGEPISFGFKLAIWYEEVSRHLARLRQVRKEIAVGKLSGAMGTFAHQGPDVEAYVCEKLGLTVDPVSNQIVQRDRHAAYATALALLGGERSRRSRLRFAICNGRRFSRRKNIFRQAKRDRRRCRTSAIRLCRKISAGWRGSSGPTV